MTQGGSEVGGGTLRSSALAMATATGCSWPDKQRRGNDAFHYSRSRQQADGDRRLSGIRFVEFASNAALDRGRTCLIRDAASIDSAPSCAPTTSCPFARSKRRARLLRKTHRPRLECAWHLPLPVFFPTPHEGGYRPVGRAKQKICAPYRKRYIRLHVNCWPGATMLFTAARSCAVIWATLCDGRRRDRRQLNRGRRGQAFPAPARPAAQ